VQVTTARTPREFTLARYEEPASLTLRQGLVGCHLEVQFEHFAGSIVPSDLVSERRMMTFASTRSPAHCPSTPEAAMPASWLLRAGSGSLERHDGGLRECPCFVKAAVSFAPAAVSLAVQACTAAGSQTACCWMNPMARWT
jgi:hypothetical protein